MLGKDYPQHQRQILLEHWAVCPVLLGFVFPSDCSCSDSSSVHHPEVEVEAGFVVLLVVYNRRPWHNHQFTARRNPQQSLLYALLRQQRLSDCRQIARLDVPALARTASSIR